MGIEFIKDIRLSTAIRNNLENSRFFPVVNGVISENLSDYEVYLLGGAVRDPIIAELHGIKNETRDFDLLVDDTNGRINFKKLLRNFNNIYYSRFGAPKLKPVNGLEIDIVSFSNASRLLKSEDNSISLDTSLQSCELTTSALAYKLSDGTIYSYQAFESIMKKEIELLYFEEEEECILMCRLVLHSEKLGFAIGEKATRLIVEGYSHKLDPHIKRYLEYKEISHRFSFVIDKLKSIQESTKL
jgi:tRNA nucleotidyltransferase/poly(A) polymerase